MYQQIAYADWTSREARAMLRCFLAGRVHKGPSPEILREQLSVLYAPSSVHVLSSAHHAISLALKQFLNRMPLRDEVIVPAYICPSVPNTVRACGLKVRWVDVRDDLNLCSESVALGLGPRTLAVIAPHMFGSPAPIAEIEKLCRDSKVALIDDAAQVAGVRVDGRLLGTFGDVGVISFAQSKTIVTGVRGSGGVMLVNRPEYVGALGDECARLPPSKSRCTALLDFLLNYQGSRHWRTIGYRMARLSPSSFGPADVNAQPLQISNLEASIALAQLSRLEQLLAEKRRLVDSYHTALKAFPLLQLPQYAEGRFLARIMVKLPDGVNLARIRRKALLSGVETRLGYAVAKESTTAALRATKLASQVIGLPMRSGMTDHDVIFVCAVLNDAIEQ